MCNRVVLKTGDTIFEDGICYDACVFNGIKCKILEDGRGKRAKFWIITPTKDKYLLKYNDNDVNTLENAGQFIMDGIFDQLSQNHAKYLVVDFEKDGVKYDAILSKNFKLNDFRELSGLQLIINWLIIFMTMKMDIILIFIIQLIIIVRFFSYYIPKSD